MKLKLLSILAALMLAACSSTSDTATGNTSGTGAGVDSSGLPGGAGVSSTGLGGPGGAGHALPGTQEDLEVNVGDRVFFGFDSSSVDDAGRQTLERQAQWLHQFPNVTVTIEGHTDEKGTREYNLALGERRAAAARDVLVGLGIPQSRIRTLSYGKERPQDPANDAVNRRAVTIVNLSS
jgi:peptidoglycan-associated lipoprotein